MSIRYNGKQIASNYTNINIEDFKTEMNEILQNINTTGNQFLEDIDTKANQQISAINSTGSENVQNVENAGDTKIEEINNLGTELSSIIEALSIATVGSEKVWRGETAPTNYIFMQGQLVSRTDYKQLFDWAVSNNLIVEDSEWTSSKKYGLYSYGDGSSTFRIPNMTGYYLVGYDSTHHTGIGIEQLDTLPNITGELDIKGTNDSTPISTSSASGAFKITKKESQAYPITGSTTLTDNQVEKITFGISDFVATGDRVQPRSIPVQYVVCYKSPWEK